MKKVMLVDEKDNPIGEEEKVKAHEEGKLHRCFSVLIFNSRGDLLIQKRAKSKYHSGGLWSNTCCSHPLGKNIEKEAEKRLKEEMGFSCKVKEIFSFIYNLKVGKLCEHEFSHVLTGVFDGDPNPNPEEAEDWKRVSPKDLMKDIKLHPKKYASWFKLISKKLFNNKVQNKTIDNFFDK
jgi:isopentenyl-diphosphate delta-isomerase